MTRVMAAWSIMLSVRRCMARNADWWRWYEGSGPLRMVVAPAAC